MKKKLILPVLLAGASLCAASTVHASAVATAYLNVYNVKLTDSSGNKLNLDSNIFFNSAVNNNGDTNAALTGFAPVHFEADQAAGPGGLDIQAAVINSGYVENSFAHLTKPNPAPSDYTVGDANLTGAIVNIGGVTPDAQARTLAESALVSPGFTSSASGNNVGVQGNVSFTFTAATSGTINISFLADAYVRAALTGTSTGSANASINWSISLFDETTQSNQSFSPEALNGDAARSATVNGQDFEYNLSGQGFTRAFNINAGDRYQLTINHVSNTDAKLNATVPEPMSLMLMSFGLLGLGWSRRFQKSV